jgi:hypothetical protein
MAFHRLAGTPSPSERWYVEASGRVFQDAVLTRRSKGMEVPMAAQPMEFRFTMGSTYTYLSASRLDSVAKAAGIPVRRAR